MSALLEVSGLSKSYGRFKALQDVSFEVHAGEVTAIIGPNGAGKSTCFALLDGQLTPDAGAIVFNGHTITRRTPGWRARRGIARTFQVAKVFPSLTVLENLRIACMPASPLWRWTLPAAERPELLDTAAALGLTAHLTQAAGILPYGVLKRLELAIAITPKPQLLLLDEPTAGLAEADARQLLDLVSLESQRRQMAVVFCEHSEALVFQYASRVLVLDQGRRVAFADAQTVRRDPAVRALYLTP